MSTYFNNVISISTLTAVLVTLGWDKSLIMSVYSENNLDDEDLIEISFKYNNAHSWHCHSDDFICNELDSSGISGELTNIKASSILAMLEHDQS
jgi:hypothetical protein